MSLISDIYNSPKVSSKARTMLMDLLELEIEGVADGKFVFKKTRIDPDMPVFRPLFVLKEGASFNDVPNAKEFPGGMAFSVHFVSLNKLKELLNHPSVESLYEIDKPAYPLEAIRQHYPKQPPAKPKGPRPSL